MSQESKPKDSVLSPVAPVESVSVPKPEIIDACWNCGESLDSSVCSACGFDKRLLYNLNLEAEKAAQRQKADQTK